MIRDLSPFFVSLDQWRRQAMALCQQLKTRELSPYEEFLVAEVEAHADEEWKTPEFSDPAAPFDDRWIEDE